MKRESELFADMAHGLFNQKRKYTNEPYIVHPRNVAYLVQMVGGTDEMIDAAYLHDVLEDVAPKSILFGEEEIERRFGIEVLSLVKWVTDISCIKDGNREKRKKIDRMHIGIGPKEAQTIKLADLIDNSLTIVKYDPDFSKIYLKEKRLLLSVLNKGDKNLLDIANNILLKNGY